MDKKEWIVSFQDPRWQKKRLEVLERDKWTCRICGDKEKTLTVHHSFYDFETDRFPWEYPDYSLFTLCVDCHEKEKEEVATYVSLINDLIYNLPLLSTSYRYLYHVLSEPVITFDLTKYYGATEGCGKSMEWMNILKSIRAITDGKSEENQQQ